MEAILTRHLSFKDIISKVTREHWCIRFKKNKIPTDIELNTLIKHLNEFEILKTLKPMSSWKLEQPQMMAQSSIYKFKMALY